MRLFEETDLKIWWQRYAYGESFNLRTHLEHLWKVKEFVAWQPLLIPGLLQLPDYLRALCLATPKFPHDEIEDRVNRRLAMQEIFRQRLNCTFFIHEQVLLLPAGGQEVLRAQLHHLLAMSVRPYIDLRIVPFAAGAHAGLAGSVDLMRFDRIEPVVFLEGEKSNLVVERKDTVEDYENVIKALGGIALDAEDSRRLIAKLAA